MAKRKRRVAVRKNNTGKRTSGGLSTKSGRVRKWEKVRAPKRQNAPVITITPPALDEQRYAPHGVRMHVLRRDGYKCRYCGVSVTNDSANMDHVIPWKDGGKSVRQNLVTACRKCNKAKGNDHWQPERKKKKPVKKKTPVPQPIPDYISQRYTFVEERPGKRKNVYSCNECSEHVEEKHLGRHITRRCSKKW